MKRAQIVEVNKPLVVSRVQLPAVPPRGVLVKTSYAGICHSDVHQLEDAFTQGDDTPLRFTDNPGYKLPVVPGHEISGVVCAVGDSAAGNVRMGDRVVIYPWMGCGKCGYCRNNNSNLCRSNHLSIGLAISGGYASYVAVRESKFVVKLPDSVPLDVACMFSCSGLVAFNSVITALPTIKAAIMHSGKARLLLIGAGGLGLWSVQIAKHVLPSECSLSAADISEEKLKIAKSLGCNETVYWNSSSDEKQLMKASIKSGHYDVIIDYVNNSTTANRGFSCLKNQGKLIMVGLFGGVANFSLPKMVLGAKSVQGIYIASLPKMKELIAMASRKQLLPPPLQYFRLEEVNTALDLVKRGEIKGRGIIDFTNVESQL